MSLETLKTSLKQDGIIKWFYYIINHLFINGFMGVRLIRFFLIILESETSLTSIIFNLLLFIPSVSSDSLLNNLLLRGYLAYA